MNKDKLWTQVLLELRALNERTAQKAPYWSLHLFADGSGAIIDPDGEERGHFNGPGQAIAKLKKAKL